MRLSIFQVDRIKLLLRNNRIDRFEQSAKNKCKKYSPTKNVGDNNFPVDPYDRDRINYSDNRGHLLLSE